MSAQKGLTLIELLVGLAILGILVGVVFPGFQQMLARNNLATSANSVILAASYARAEAVREGGRVRLVARDGDDSDGYGGGGADWALGWAVVSVNDPAVAGDDVLLRIFDPVSDTLDVASNITWIDFSGQGLVAATAPDDGSGEPLVPATIDVCLADVAADGVRVSVTAVGRASTDTLAVGDCP